MYSDGFSCLHLQCERFDERWEWIGNRWLEQYQVTRENVLRHRCDNDVTPATNSGILTIALKMDLDDREQSHGSTIIAT